MSTPSRNERLARMTERGKNKISSYARAASIPVTRCSKRYTDICEDTAIVSISNPDNPHLYIRFCGPCLAKYRDSKPREAVDEAVEVRRPLGRITRFRGSQ